MKRFVEEADRGQWTLLPECLDHFIDESNPVRVIDVFVDALDLAEMSFEGAEPRNRLALHLRLSEPGAVEPAARTGGHPQCRGHVAASRSITKETLTNTVDQLDQHYKCYVYNLGIHPDTRRMVFASRTGSRDIVHDLSLIH